MGWKEEEDDDMENKDCDDEVQPSSNYNSTIILDRKNLKKSSSSIRRWNQWSKWFGSISVETGKPINILSSQFLTSRRFEFHRQFEGLHYIFSSEK